MRTFFYALVSRIRAVFRRRDLDRDFAQELDTHLAMAAEDNIRRGMTPEQARRTARVKLGGVTQLREAGRAAWGLMWLDRFALDVKLGLRMLRKSWGLTLVGGLAMTTAMAIVIGLVSTVQAINVTTVPLDEGDRVVALLAWNAPANRRQSALLRDVVRWRGAVRSIENIGAFRTVERSLAIADSPAEPVSVAEITASGFELTRVPPLLGRPLIEDDEREGAIPVVVIGYEAWRTRFAADPAVVGRRVWLGPTLHTIVGVMPEDFAFPVNHRFWAPLRTNPSVDAQDESTAVFAFGRLAPGVTPEGAQAELSTIGLLPSVAAPANDGRIYPLVLPYAIGLTGGEGYGVFLTGTFLLTVTLLLVPPAANIAILVYARTVTRQQEFAARVALGATRGRIVGQLFIEVLVLAAAAVGSALVVVRLTGGYLESIIRLPNGNPFWLDIGAISVRTALFAAGLGLLAALIAGVAPALQATGHLMQSGLRALGSRTGMQLGVTWTVLVVAQLAFSIAVLPVAIELAWGTLRPTILGPGFMAEEFLTARLVLDQTPPRNAAADEPPFAARFEDLQTELVRRLEAEPDISAVTVSAAVPGGEPTAAIVMNDINGTAPPAGGASGRSSPMGVGVNRVDTAFFDVFDIPLLAGRTFEVGDLQSTRAVIVDRTFAQRIAGDVSPLGRRVRYIGTVAGPAVASETWYEIVGVVDDLPANTGVPRMYHPIARGEVHPVSLALRVRPGSPTVASRFRETTAALAPTLRLEAVAPLDELYRQRSRSRYLAGVMVAAVALSVLLLSAAGMYALMSFIVNQRRREIGIRSALGASRDRLLAGIFKRTLAQLAAGAAVGVLAAYLLGVYLPIEEAGGRDLPGVLPAAAALMMVVGLLAAAGPARRALRIEPAEAVRES